MQHLSTGLLRENPVSGAVLRCQGLVRFCALLRIKPHAPPLVRAPVNSFEFQPCDRTSQVVCLPGYLRHRISPISSIHRLRRGLPGYLILFDPHTFGSECQSCTRKSPSPLVFLRISTNFTSTLGIPLTSLDLKTGSFKGSSGVEPRDFTPDFPIRLRALYAQ